MARIPKVRLFADGENLVFRYQEMLSQGRNPKKGVIHIPDEFVWSDEITTAVCYDLVRASFYTSAAGDDDKIRELRKIISKTGYEFAYTPDNEVPNATGFLVPCVFKKERKSKKSRSVDIQMTIDIYKHAMRGDADHFLILTGDGDFIPIIKECMSLGIEVHAMGFSSGLNPEIEICSDTFVFLDEYFFEQKNEPSKSVNPTGSGR